VDSGVFGLEVFGDDSVESASSFISDDSGVDLEGVSLLVLLDEFLFLKLLESPSDDLSSGVLVSFGSALASVESSVNVGEESDSGSWADVNFSGKRSDLVVNPVLVDGGEFVACIMVIRYWWRV
jgi:hypothetical protein